MGNTMQFTIENAAIFVPDSLPVEKALARTTYLAVGAHQDDLEIMAYSGVAECFQRQDKWYTGVVVTNGSGSPRDDLYKDYTDDEMMVVRRKEQNKAAVVGEYAAQVLLEFPSSMVKNPSDNGPVADLKALLVACKPELVYTHNLADKHETHVGVTLKLIQAIREIPAGERPQMLIGCEVWRGLDWMLDESKIVLDTTARENLQAALLGVFDSQICGGKRYDLATMGRRKANATYFQSHGVDVYEGANFAMDLTPLIDAESTTDPAEFIGEHVQRFLADVTERVKRLS